jgi:Double zinc ribbon
VKPMKNVRNLSIKGGVDAGYQYEFYCHKCDFTWRSQFKSNRMGQLTGWLNNLAFLAGGLRNPGRLGGVISEAGSRSGGEKSLVEAQEQARRYFTLCKKCDSQVCQDCWSDDEQTCKPCLDAGRSSRGNGQANGGADTGPCCPNCQAPSSGGRFCHECGFDMASTHKGCPGCGSVMPRAARFCTDCGHGF